MALLDDLSGFEFEDVMVDVFRHLGYEEVRAAERVADKGRDIVMEEVLEDGTRRAVVVECKHTDTVGRPDVQKLHSATKTYDFDGPTRGMVATSGRFTEPAREYAENVARDGFPPIELFDGEALRAAAEEIGMDLYNGRIEIVCEACLPVQSAHLTAPVTATFATVEHLDESALPDPASVHVSLRPTLVAKTHVDATFSTSVGVIHRIDEHAIRVLDAGRDSPAPLEEPIAKLVVQHLDRARPLETLSLDTAADRVERVRFGLTETEYRDRLVEQERARHATTVRYTGDNNVTYTRECVPGQSDVRVNALEAVYRPHIRAVTQLGDHRYPLEWVASDETTVTIEDGIRRCVKCGSRNDRTYTCCPECLGITCPRHVETDRLTDEPVCTDCAVTGQFMLRTRYFRNPDNREAFRAEWAAMGPLAKLRENPYLLAAIVFVALAMAAAGAFLFLLVLMALA